MKADSVINTRLMGFDYTVKPANPNGPELSSGSSSIIEHSTQSICISTALGVQAAVSGFIHEVFHGILEHSGMADVLAEKDVNEEALVLCLENGWYRFFLENDNYIDISNLQHVIERIVSSNIK